MSADQALLPAPCEPCGSRGRVPAQMRDDRIGLMSLVVRAYRHLTDNLNRELRQAVGIPPVFFEVLIHVAAAPRGRQTMSRLSEEVALTKGGVTRLIDRMVEAGLVVREHSSSDRRSTPVALTEVGQKILDRAIATHVESIDRHLIAPLNNNDRASLTVTLTKVLRPGLSGGAPSEGSGNEGALAAKDSALTEAMRDVYSLR